MAVCLEGAGLNPISRRVIMLIEGDSANIGSAIPEILEILDGYALKTEFFPQEGAN